MQFDLRANSSDMTTPVHLFSGDEGISPEVYRSVVYGGYVTTTATLYGAARSMGLCVDVKTFERWKRIGAAAGLLDDFLDESPDPAESQRLYDQGLVDQLNGFSSVSLPEWGDSRLVPAVNLMFASMGDLPKLQQYELIASARSIGQIAIKKASACDIETYTGLLKQEAIDTSNLIRFSSSENMHCQPRFERFADWCDQAITLGTLYDHARDLPDDYRLGRTVVEPSIRNQLKLGAQALKPFRHLMQSYTNRHASRAAIAARIRYSPQLTKRMFKRQE